MVCLGLDPVVEKIPVPEHSIEKKITVFFEKILDSCASENALPNVVKPNYAFFAQYGFDGLHALEKTIAKAHSMGLPVILDAKRNDIGKTAEAYARECFDFWKVDAVTVNPFLGSDSVEPFLKWCREKGKGIFALNRTSNPGASDFQTKKMDSGKLLFHSVSEKIVEWGKQANGNVGAVVGATSPLELDAISGFFCQQSIPVPLLIPGVGTQGGSAEETVSVLKKNRYPLETVVINSSSGVLYAHEKQAGIPFEEAALKELKKLREQTRF
jgi:orotidine-5'-phosphate decarboxylase